ncbi:MAG: nucleotidyltransferase family protein [Pseudomonadota bacterium]
MKPDPQAFQESAARALQRVAADRPVSFDWLEQHGLLGMACAWANELGLPTDLREYLQAWRSAFAAQWLSWQQCWPEALAALEAPLVLKGAALNTWLYPDPTLRPVGDLDILINSADREAACDALLALGYHPELAVDGDLVMTQQRFTLDNHHGPTCHLDLHWQSSNRSELAAALSYDVLINLSEEASPGLRVLTPAAAWLHAAAHLLGHHADRPAMKWLLDLHLIWELMSPSQRSHLVALATRRGLAPIASATLELCSETLGTRFSETARHRLLAGARQRTRHYVSGRSTLLQDLRALPRFRPRLRYLRQLLFPSRRFMDARGFGGHPLGYLRRLAGGFAKALTRALDRGRADSRGPGW